MIFKSQYMFATITKRSYDIDKLVNYKKSGLCLVDLLFPGCWEMIYVMFSSVLFIDWSFPLESVLGQCHKTAQTNQH